MKKEERTVKGGDQLPDRVKDISNRYPVCSAHCCEKSICIIRTKLRNIMAALATAILRGLTSHQHLDELLARGVDVADMNFRDPLGRSLVHLAAEENDISAIRWLMHHRADPMATTLREGAHFNVAFALPLDDLMP